MGDRKVLEDEWSAQCSGWTGARRRELGCSGLASARENRRGLRTSLYILFYQKFGEFKFYQSLIVARGIYIILCLFVGK